MPYQIFDLKPVDRITTDAIGQPGRRVFYLQGRKGNQLVTIICEKEHVASLAQAIDHVLLSMADHDIDAVVEPDPELDKEMDLEYPLEPAFRAGRVNLGFDKSSQDMVVMAYELMDEDDDTPPSTARFWATPAQMRAFSIQAHQVVAAGRPICAMCGQPIDPEGHFCPRKNGHRT
jgi:uncharacterized repeat protein (TIGR03847 family)